MDHGDPSEEAPTELYHSNLWAACDTYLRDGRSHWVYVIGSDVRVVDHNLEFVGCVPVDAVGARRGAMTCLGTSNFDGFRLVVGATDCVLLYPAIHPLSTASACASVLPMQGVVTAVAIAKNLLVVAFAEGGVRTWGLEIDMKTGKHTATPRWHVGGLPGPVEALRISPDARRLALVHIIAQAPTASAARPGGGIPSLPCVSVYSSLESKSPGRPALLRHSAPVSSLQWRPLPRGAVAKTTAPEPLILTVCVDGDVRVWRRARGAGWYVAGQIGRRGAVRSSSGVGNRVIGGSLVAPTSGQDPTCGAGPVWVLTARKDGVVDVWRLGPEVSRPRSRLHLTRVARADPPSRDRAVFHETSLFYLGAAHGSFSRPSASSNSATDEASPLRVDPRPGSLHLYAVTREHAIRYWQVRVGADPSLPPSARPCASHRLAAEVFDKGLSAKHHHQVKFAASGAAGLVAIERNGVVLVWRARGGSTSGLADTRPLVFLAALSAHSEDYIDVSWHDPPAVAESTASQTAPLLFCSTPKRVDVYKCDSGGRAAKIGSLSYQTAQAQSPAQTLLFTPAPDVKTGSATDPEVRPTSPNATFSSLHFRAVAIEVTPLTGAANGAAALVAVMGQREVRLFRWDPPPERSSSGIVKSASHAILSAQTGAVPTPSSTTLSTPTAAGEIPSSSRFTPSPTLPPKSGGLSMSRSSGNLAGLGGAIPRRAGPRRRARRSRRLSPSRRRGNNLSLDLSPLPRPDAATPPPSGATLRQFASLSVARKGLEFTSLALRARAAAASGGCDLLTGLKDGRVLSYQIPSRHPHAPALSREMQLHKDPVLTVQPHGALFMATATRREAGLWALRPASEPRCLDKVRLEPAEYKLEGVSPPVVRLVPMGNGRPLVFTSYKSRVRLRTLQTDGSGGEDTFSTHRPAFRDIVDPPPDLTHITVAAQRERAAAKLPWWHRIGDIRGAAPCLGGLLIVTPTTQVLASVATPLATTLGSRVTTAPHNPSALALDLVCGHLPRVQRTLKVVDNAVRLAARRAGRDAAPTDADKATPQIVFPPDVLLSTKDLLSSAKSAGAGANAAAGAGSSGPKSIFAKYRRPVALASAQQAQPAPPAAAENPRLARLKALRAQLLARRRGQTAAQPPAAAAAAPSTGTAGGGTKLLCAVDATLLSAADALQASTRIARAAPDAISLDPRGRRDLAAVAQSASKLIQAGGSVDHFAMTYLCAFETATAALGGVDAASDRLEAFVDGWVDVNTATAAASNGSGDAKKAPPSSTSAGDADAASVAPTQELFGFCGSWSFACAALHSKDQDALLRRLSQMSGLGWAVLRAVGAVWWVREDKALRTLVETAAKNVFRRAKRDPAPAMLWYLLVGKLDVLRLLFKMKSDEKSQKMLGFLEKDFSDPDGAANATARKLAMVYISRHRRYKSALTFLLLAKAHKAAVQVAMQHLKSPALVALIARLLMQPSERRAVFDELLRPAVRGDPWRGHLLAWHSGRRVESLQPFKDYLSAAPSGEPENLLVAAPIGPFLRLVSKSRVMCGGDGSSGGGNGSGATATLRASPRLLRLASRASAMSMLMLGQAPAALSEIRYAKEGPSDADAKSGGGGAAEMDMEVAGAAGAQIAANSLSTGTQTGTRAGNGTAILQSLSDKFGLRGSDTTTRVRTLAQRRGSLELAAAAAEAAGGRITAAQTAQASSSTSGPPVACGPGDGLLTLLEANLDAVCGEFETRDLVGAASRERAARADDERSLDAMLDTARAVEALRRRLAARADGDPSRSEVSFFHEKQVCCVTTLLCCFLVFSARRDFVGLRRVLAYCEKVGFPQMRGAETADTNTESERRRRLDAMLGTPGSAQSDASDDEEKEGKDGDSDGDEKTDGKMAGEDNAEDAQEEPDAYNEVNEKMTRMLRALDDMTDTLDDDSSFADSLARRCKDLSMDVVLLLSVEQLCASVLQMPRRADLLPRRSDRKGASSMAPPTASASARASPTSASPPTFHASAPSVSDLAPSPPPPLPYAERALSALLRQRSSIEAEVRRCFGDVMLDAAMVRDAQLKNAQLLARARAQTPMRRRRGTNSPDKRDADDKSDSVWVEDEDSLMLSSDAKVWDLSPLRTWENAEEGGAALHRSVGASKVLNSIADAVSAFAKTKFARVNGESPSASRPLCVFRPVEIYKSPTGSEQKRRLDAPSSVAVNAANADFMAVATGYGIRELRISTNLAFRMRTLGKRRLHDGEAFTWQGCLHRFDAQAQELLSDRTSRLAIKHPNPDPVDALEAFLQDSPLLRVAGTAVGAANASKPSSLYERYMSAVARYTRAGGDAADSSRNIIVTSLAAHPSLPIYASVTKKGRVQIWHYARRGALWELAVGPGGSPIQASLRSGRTVATRVRFNDAGNKLAAACSDGKVFVWHTGVPRGPPPSLPVLVLNTSSYAKPIHDIAFLKGSGSLLAVAGTNRSGSGECLSVWDTILPKQLGFRKAFRLTRSGPTAPQGDAIPTSALCMAYTGGVAARGAVVVVGTEKGSLHSFDLDSMTRGPVAEGAHVDKNGAGTRIDVVAFDAGSDVLASAGLGGDVKLWKADDLTPLRTFSGVCEARSLRSYPGHPGFFTSFGILHLYFHNGSLYACSAEGTVVLFGARRACGAIEDM